MILRASSSRWSLHPCGLLYTLATSRILSRHVLIILRSHSSITHRSLSLFDHSIFLRYHSSSLIIAMISASLWSPVHSRDLTHLILSSFDLSHVSSWSPWSSGSPRRSNLMHLNCQCVVPYVRNTCRFESSFVLTLLISIILRSYSSITLSSL